MKRRHAGPIGDAFRANAQHLAKLQAALGGERLSREQIESRAADAIESLLGPWRSLAPEIPGAVAGLVVLRAYGDGPVIDASGQEVSAEKIAAYERGGGTVYIVHCRIVQSCDKNE